MVNSWAVGTPFVSKHSQYMTYKASLVLHHSPEAGQTSDLVACMKKLRTWRRNTLPDVTWVASGRGSSQSFLKLQSQMCLFLLFYLLLF